MAIADGLTAVSTRLPGHKCLKSLMDIAVTLFQSQLLQVTDLVSCALTAMLSSLQKPFVLGLSKHFHLE
jgi:hypothetical protein